MSKLSKKKKTIIVIITAIALIITAFSIYRINKLKLFDKKSYKEIYKTLEDESENFKSQEDLRDFITAWADKSGLKYSIDGSDNIIFTHEANSRKKKVSPTVVLVSYNYENVSENNRVLASAAMLASSDINSGKRTVIFVNNINNNGDSYMKLNPSFFTKKAKVVYLDYGKHSYISKNSFASANRIISIPATTTNSNCDTAIKIRISGLMSDCVDTGINKKANPISLLSTVLTRLKTKSTICQIADISVDNKGNMYPGALEATILVNSYSVNSLCSYLDKRIKKFEKFAKKDNPDCEYTYEILSGDAVPDTAYDDQTFDSLTTLLYTIMNGTKRLEDDDLIPEGYEISDISCIQAPVQLLKDEANLYLDVYTQAINNDFLNDATKDIDEATKLSGCEVVASVNYPKYSNKKDSLERTMQSTYFKVSDLFGDGFSLDEDYDTYFTPMSYIASINKNVDMVHIKINKATASVITNMLICYFETKGNFLSL